MLARSQASDFEQQVTTTEPLVHSASEYATTLKVAVMKRILLTLHENGSMRITNLAVRTRMNYSKCTKYVNLMALFQWVEVVSIEGRYVLLAQRGRETVELLSDLS